MRAFKSRLLCLGVAVGIVLVVTLQSTGSMAITLTVSEDQIASLANAPALLSLDASVDEAGRPSLHLELEFANECYAAAGVDIRVVPGPADKPAAVAIVTQRVVDSGCPDIFQPKRLKLQALLPSGLAGRELAVIARPGPPEVIRTVRLGGAEREPAVADALQEVSVSSGEVVPVLEAPGVRVAEPSGYDLTGQLQIAAGCTESDLRVQVFEIPDAQGTPSSDAVLITAPARCATSRLDDRAELSIHIETPQTLNGRRVVSLNTAPPIPLTLAP